MNDFVNLFFEKNLDKNYQDLKKVIDILKSNSDLKTFLESNEYTNEDKISVFENIFISQINSNLISFFVYLIKNNAIKNIEEIYENIKNKYLEKSNKIKINIYSASKLSDTEISKIKEIYEKKYEVDDSELNIIIDQKLIGGIKVVINDDVYDNTIKNKLENIKKSINLEKKSINNIIEEELNKNNITKYEYGLVIELDEEIVKINGLKKCEYGEILDFEDGSKALALNLEQNCIGAIFINKNSTTKIGTKVFRTNKPASIPVSEKLLGRVIDSLGNFIDGKEDIEIDNFRSIEFPAPGIMERKEINRPLKTGIIAIDAMVPIGKGQRELIIGDKQTGKTTLAVDTIINQKDKDVICIYVAIGQKTSTIENIIKVLKNNNAMDNTIVLTATSSDFAAKQYIAPYSGCAIAEYFMYEKKKDVLIVYDDLTKHANAYRTISLLLRRPPGREAYPGDIFYIHSRLLERASQLNDELGGGSITAIPIVETEEGDISAYIPTNIISITDGQIRLDKDFFHEGQKPAIHAGLSVSRVGSAAQSIIMKHVSMSIRLLLSQYWDLEVFSEFGTDLDEITKSRLNNGKRVLEVLKQQKHHLIKEEDQVIILFTALNNYLEDIEINNVKDFVINLIEYIKNNYLDFYNDIKNFKKEDLINFDEKMKNIITEFKNRNKNG